MSTLDNGHAIAWQQQGSALVGAISFRDGRQGNVAIVDGPGNARGIALVLPAQSGEEARTILLSEGLDLLHSRQLIEILCMQERSFGGRGLPSPENLA